MIGALVIAAAVVSAVLFAAGARGSSLVSALLLAYLALLVDTVGLVLVLSPFREVTRAGLGIGEAVVLVAALGTWWYRGRPRLPTHAAQAALRKLIACPPALLFLGVIVLLLAYELVLGLTVPPNNWDSLTYHLARAAAWAQHGGYYWIANAPTDRLNEFQPVAEQELLFLFAATGGAALFAIPQYLAGLAAILAVYGAARRLGYEVAAAVCGACLLGTFSLVALEATTAQNDLVAASLPIVALFFLLGSRRLDWAAAGFAVGLGIGVKLTTVLVLPILVWIALTRGRKPLLAAAAGGVAGFVSIGMWGFVLNVVHTGHLLGHGGGRLENTASPSYPGTVATIFYTFYSLMDLSKYSHRVIDLLAVIGGISAVAIAVHAIRIRRQRRLPADSLWVSIPFLAPLLTIAGGGVLAFIARRWGFPVRGRGGVVGNITNQVGEDFSAFGPVGSVMLVLVPLLTAWRYRARKADIRQLALSITVPTFVILLSLEAKYNAFVTRFVLISAVLAAPLLPQVFRNRLTSTAYVVVATLTAALTLAHVQAKPIDGPYGRPWSFTPEQALASAGDPAAGAALASFDRLVPSHACVGAILGTDEPAYLLYGPHFVHRVDFLSVNGSPVLQALRDGLFYVVISTGPNRYVATQFRADGWTIRSLGGYWLLASEPHATTGTCRA